MMTNTRQKSKRGSLLSVNKMENTADKSNLSIINKHVFFKSESHCKPPWIPRTVAVFPALSRPTITRVTFL